MILAHSRSSVYGELLAKIRAFVFFGVPHRGADLAYWARFATVITKNLSLGFTGNLSHVEALKRNSQAFAKISQLFVERGANVPIRTFYEAERTKNQVVSSIPTLLTMIY